MKQRFIFNYLKFATILHHQKHIIADFTAVFLKKHYSHTREDLNNKKVSAENIYNETFNTKITESYLMQL